MGRILAQMVERVLPINSGERARKVYRKELPKMAVGMVVASGGGVTTAEGMIQLGWLEEGDCLCAADQRA
jgi:hypothetical protein